MRAATIIGSAISLASMAAARINGIAAPSTVGVNSNVSLTILTEGYIQSVQDVAISFGIWPQITAFPETLGSLLSSKYIGPDESNVSDRNLTHYVHIPSDTPKGPTTLTAALFSLYGARLSGVLTYYTVNITVGDTTDSGSLTTSLPA